MQYEFDWSVLWRDPYGEWMLEGIWLTLRIGLAAWVIALVLGVVVGSIRTAPWLPLRVLGTAYVEFFRNIPLLVQLFFWFYAVPPLIGQWLNRLPELKFYVAVVGLGIYTASRVAEHLRSGLNSVPRGQRWAALSTGLTELQIYRYVVVPHALRLIIPPLTTEWLTVFKNSSLAMTIGVLELAGASYQIDAYTFHGLEATTGAVAVYIVIGLTVIFIMGRLEHRFRIPGLVRRE